jgi:hypothetical protein
MSTIESGAALVALLVTASLSAGIATQPGKSAAPDVKPYPGSREFCREHIAGAPRGDQAGAHLSWTGFHSSDPPEKVVSHYMKTLGPGHHRTVGSANVWRFPLDEPTVVVSVTHPEGGFPRGQCRPPPESARTIVIISTMGRPE